jgi:hypothetical protein
MDQPTAQDLWIRKTSDTEMTPTLNYLTTGEETGAGVRAGMPQALEGIT